MIVIRSTDYVFQVKLAISELEALRTLGKGYNISMEKTLQEMIECNLLGSDKTEPESEDAHELEGKNEGIRRG